MTILFRSTGTDEQASYLRFKYSRVKRLYMKKIDSLFWVSEIYLGLKLLTCLQNGVFIMQGAWHLHWYMVSFFCFTDLQPPSKGHPFYTTWGCTVYLCGLNPKNYHKYQPQKYNILIPDVESPSDSFSNSPRSITAELSGICKRYYKK